MNDNFTWGVVCGTARRQSADVLIACASGGGCRRSNPPRRGARMMLAKKRTGLSEAQSVTDADVQSPIEAAAERQSVDVVQGPGVVVGDSNITGRFVADPNIV